MKKHTILGVSAAVVMLSVSAVMGSFACSPVTRTFHGGSGGGGGEACNPGETKDCYDGPPGTEDMGNCKHGTAKCGDDGKLGVCEGATKPVPAGQIECAKHEDQDCDGVPDRCPLDFIWGAAYGVAGGAGLVPPALGIDPDGNVVIAGFMNGQLDFGNGTLASASGDADVFVAKLDPTGKALWSQKFGDATQDQTLYGAAVDGQGNIILGGAYHGTMDGLNTGFPPSVGSQDAWVAKLDPSGAPIWGRSGGDIDSQEVQALAVTPKGDVVVAGRTYGSFAFSAGGPMLTNAAGNGSVIFVQFFDALGNPGWGVTFTGPDPDAGTFGYQDVANVAVDANGDVLLTGYFDGDIGFPGHGTHSSAGQSDVWVAKLHGADGAVLWAKTFGGPGNDNGQSVAVDSQLSIIISGSFEGSITMDGKTATPMPGYQYGLYLAKLTPSGNVTWLNGYGSGNQINGLIASTAENNTILLCGGFDGSADFGGGVLSAGVMPGTFASAGFLAKLDTDGKHIASKIFAPIVPDLDGGQPMFPFFDITFRVAATPKTNEVVTAGITFLKTDLGGGPIGKEGIGNPFLGKFAP